MNQEIFVGNRAIISLSLDTGEPTSYVLIVEHIGQDPLEIPMGDSRLQGSVGDIYSFVATEQDTGDWRCRVTGIDANGSEFVSPSDRKWMEFRVI